MNSWIGFVQTAFLLFGVTSGGVAKGDASYVEYDVKEWLKKETKFYIHTNRHQEGIEFNFEKKSPDIQMNAVTKIITHGFRGTKDDVQIIVEEYLKGKNKVNVLTYDWRHIAEDSRLKAAMGAVAAGGFVLGRRIPELEGGFGIKPEQIHLIGYDMGAHLMGAAGRCQTKKLGRITGLDPSGDHFSHSSEIELPALGREDATFVDVLHTNAGDSGIADVIGTADFFPNGGEVQPKCREDPLENCDSYASVEYFAESIKSRLAFVAHACPSYEDFVKKKCKNTPKAIFGEQGNTNVNGTYYFETNSKPLYGRKRRGENPDKF